MAEKPLGAATAQQPAQRMAGIDKNRLLESMAQEIRSPLNAILGMIELLIDSPLSPGQQEYARMIQNSGDALLVLVNDLLDYAHLESGELELTETAVDLRSCMDDALEMVASHGAGRTANVAFFIESGVPEVIHTDPIRLRQVLGRLLSYAVQHAEGSEIVVSVKARPQGLEQYEIQFVLREYSPAVVYARIDPLLRESQENESTRLGLEICHLLVKKMGGSLSTGRQQGKGVLFTFTLQAEAGSRLPSRRRQRSTQPLMGGKRVLVAVAGEQQRGDLAQQLLYWQLKPVPVRSAGQVLQALESGETLDAAILEHQLPELDVYSLSKQIRQRAAGRSLPLILIVPPGSEQVEPPVQYCVLVAGPAKPYQLYEAMSRMLAEQLRIQPAAVTSTLLDPGMAQRHPLRILLADPDAGEQKIALRFMERLGYRPEQVDNSGGVLQALLRQSYDVLIIDEELLFDDVAVLEKIEQLLPPIARPAVLALASPDLRADRSASLAGGLQDFVLKPVRAGELIRSLEECRPLRLSQAETEAYGLPGAAALAPVPGLAAITGERVKQGEQPAIDLAFLSQFSSMASGEMAPLLAQLVDLFTANAARLLVRMRQAIDSQEAAALQQAAAELRASSENLGARNLSELCAGIGRQARQSGAPDVQEQFRLLLAEYNRVRASLEQLRKDTER